MCLFAMRYITDEELVSSELLSNNYSLKLWKRKPGSGGIVMNPISSKTMQSVNQIKIRDTK
jgi:hypothetical protein